MYNKTVTVTTTELLSGVVVVPATITINRKREDLEGWFSGTLYPREFQIVNTTGCDLEWTMMASEAEYQDYLNNISEPEFDFVLLPDTEILQDEKRINKMVYFLIRPVSGNTPTSNLRIDFINHKKG